MICYSVNETRIAVSKMLDRKLLSGPTKAELFFFRFFKLTGSHHARLMTVSEMKFLDISNSQEKLRQQGKSTKIISSIDCNADRPASPKTLPQGCGGYNK